MPLVGTGCKCLLPCEQEHCLTCKPPRAHFSTGLSVLKSNNIQVTPFVVDAVFFCFSAAYTIQIFAAPLPQHILTRTKQLAPYKQEREMAKKSASAPKAAKKGAKKSSRKPKRSWNVYINRSLKSINKAVGISGKAMKIVNSFVNDVFVRVATEAANLARVNKKKTLGSREVQTAVRLVLPAELAKHAMAEGTKAIAKVSA